MQKIRHKHILAQNFFSYIPEMAEEMKVKVQKLPVPKPKEKLITVRMEEVVGEQIKREKDVPLTVTTT